MKDTDLKLGDMLYQAQVKLDCIKSDLIDSIQRKTSELNNQIVNMRVKVNEGKSNKTDIPPRYDASKFTFCGTPVDEMSVDGLRDALIEISMSSMKYPLVKKGNM